MKEKVHIYNAFFHVLGRARYCLDEEVDKHQKTLTNLTLSEAQKSIIDFFYIHNKGCCLYFIATFISILKEYNIDFQFAYIPEENPYDNNNRTSSKVIAYICIDNQEYIFDIAEAAKNLFKPGVTLYYDYCWISLDEYKKRVLLPGEVLTVLPKITSENKNENFMDFFFSNKEAKKF